MQEPNNQQPTQGQSHGGQTPTQGYAPGQTPAADVPGQTPAPCYAPGQSGTPTAPQENVIAQNNLTSAKKYVLDQIHGSQGHRFTPSQETGAAPQYKSYITDHASANSGDESGKSVPGQTSVQGDYTPGQTPAQGYAPGPGQTPAPISVPGQSTAPGYVPEQTPAPGGTPEQTPPPDDVPRQPASPSDDFTHVYRTGNFGKHFGKVSATRGKRYAIVHGVLSLLMIIFTIAAAAMMKHYIPGAIKDGLLAISWLCAAFDGLCAAVAFYFMWKLSTLKHPLSTLMILRTFAALSLTMNMFFFLVGLFSLILKKEDFVELEDKEIDLLKAMYFIITLLMFLKMFTSTSFVFHWWHCCPACPSCCACFSPYCIFEEGEDLAPGVSNSTGMLRIIMVGTAAASAARRMDDGMDTLQAEVIERI